MKAKYFFEVGKIAGDDRVKVVGLHLRVEPSNGIRDSSPLKDRKFILIGMVMSNPWKLILEIMLLKIP